MQPASPAQPAPATVAPAGVSASAAAAPAAPEAPAVPAAPVATASDAPEAADAPSTDPSVLAVPAAAPTAAAASTTGTSATAAGGAPAALPAHVAEQIRTHVRGVRALPGGTHEATLVLDPEHLGPVRIRLQVGDGTVSLQLAGVSAATADVLRDALPDLRRGLEQAGLQLGSADVADGWTTGGQPARDDAGRRQHPAGTTGTTTTGSAGISTTSTAAPRTAPGTRTDRLDLLA
jgi:flagellar hook-length control protein FliK